MILPNISLLIDSTTIEIQSLTATIEMIIVLIGMMLVGGIIAKKRSYFLN
jgi:hypothetical protein